MLLSVAFVFLLCSMHGAESSCSDFRFVIPSKQMINNCLAAQHEEVNALKLRVAELQYQLNMANLRSSLSQETPESVSQASNLESPRNPVFDCNCNNISEPFMFSYGDCSDVARLSSGPSGVYSISPVNGTGMQLQIQESDSSSEKWNFLVASTIGPLTVYCDVDGAEGWTVLMQRTKMDSSFDQSWERYKNGFGNMSHDGDFWLGLEDMHQITNQMFRTFELQIVITDASGVPYIFPYKSVKIGSETENYALNLGEYTGIISSPYAKTSLPFITRDKNPQLNGCTSHAENANLEYYSGWWIPKYTNSRYNPYSSNCQKRANLNAPNIFWNTNFGPSRKIAKVVVRIKPN